METSDKFLCTRWMNLQVPEIIIYWRIELLLASQGGLCAIGENDVAQFYKLNFDHLDNRQLFTLNICKEPSISNIFILNFLKLWKCDIHQNRTTLRHAVAHYTSRNYFIVATVMGI